MTRDAAGERRLAGDHPIPWLLPAILVVSACLNLWNFGFPLGFHADEPVKVDSILAGTQTFYHPLLLLQVVRVVNLAAGLTDPQQVVLLGRGLMALCGVATVLLSYALARRRLPPTWAAGMALSVAVSPTLVVHAHYLKEDTILTLCLIAAVVGFFRFIDRQTTGTMVWLGLASGLAYSSHYKAVLLFPLFLLAPLLGPVGRPTAYYRRLAGASLVAGIVFLAVNWPLFGDLQGFIAGATSEASHAALGEDARIGGMDYWLGFHLVHSLAPGMGWAAVLLGILGVIWTVARWKQADFQDRWLVAYLLAFYFVHEVSPLKPWPDFSRYMLPAVPVLLYFAWRAAAWLYAAVVSTPIRLTVAAGSLVATVLLPLSISGRLVYEMAHDTRTRAAEWLDAHPGSAVADRYAVDLSAGNVRSVVPLDAGDLAAALDPATLARQGLDYILVSSFVYERFAVGNRLSGQDPEVYAVHARYQELFRRSYVEIAPVYRSFGFSNPVVRIISLRGPPAQ